MNILLAWELGANFGHLARQLPVAHALHAQGHNPTFAVCDTTIATRLLGPHGYRFIQAPTIPAKPRLNLPPANYSEILLAEGFHDPALLKIHIHAWLGVFESIQPDSILLDHAPGALLAARIAGLPRVTFGSGFEIPPKQFPYPSFRVWEPISAKRLSGSDRLALANINAVCRIHRQPPLNAVHELFESAAKALLTIAELDHYGVRAGETYLGPLYAQIGGPTVEWPRQEGRRILAYLRPDVPGFHATARVLARQAQSAILVVPDPPRAWVAQHASANFAIHSAPIDVEPLLKECDLGISYGGSGTLSQFIMAGIPQMALPMNAEQYLGALRMQEAGAGFVVGKARDERTIADTLERILAEPGYQKASRAVAERYAGLSSAETVQQVVRALTGAC